MDQSPFKSTRRACQRAINSLTPGPVSLLSSKMPAYFLKHCCLYELATWPAPLLPYGYLRRFFLTSALATSLNLRLTPPNEKLKAKWSDPRSSALNSADAKEAPLNALCIEQIHRERTSLGALSLHRHWSVALFAAWSSAMLKRVHDRKRSLQT